MKKLLTLIVFVMVFTLAACNGDDTPDVEYPYDDHFGATITGSEVDGDVVVLTIDGEGFYPMTVEVTFEGGSMTNFEVIDHSESADWGGVIIDRGEIQDALVDNYDDLANFSIDPYKDVDAETGATATAEAMEDIAVAAVEHYQEYYE